TPYTVVYNGNSVLTDILYSKDGDGTVHGCSAKGQKHGTISPLPFENFTKMDHGKLSNNKRVLTLVCNTISGAVGVPYMDSDEGEEEEEEEDASISDLIKIRYSGNAAVTATIYDAVGNVVATANNIEDDGFDGNDFIYDSFSEDENSTEGSIYMPNQGYKLVFSFGTNAGSFVDFTAEVSTLVDEGLKDTSVIHTANITTTGGTVATVDGTGQAIKNNTISTLIDGNVIIHP
ncbi:MAG: hypothetical protein FWH04_08285, partial [Oscillospiraceae bacterium]|nr:hypothetical protein [Oscillospiraceae bacterium]